VLLAQAEHYTAQTVAVAAAVEAAQRTAAENQATALAAAAQQAAVEREQAVAAVRKSTAAFDDDDDETGLCRVCLDERSDVVYVPCGHICCCTLCDGTKAAGQKECMMCKALIDYKQKVFIS
jgi:E3 ubiquitin-protein ligase MUL1